MIPMSLGALAVSIYVDHTGIDTGARTAIGKLEQLGRTLQQRGLSQLFVGISLAIPFKKAIEDAAAFDKQMRLVSTVTKDTTKYMGQYTEAVKQMAFEFGESTATISKGLYDILSSQIDEAHALDVLRVALKGAIGGMTDTAVAADATVAMLNSYSLSAKYATDVSDWLFKTVELGTITYEELSSHIGFVASTAAMAGVSLEDLGAAIATITHTGLQADHTIVALYNIMKEFLDPSNEAAETARQLGFEMNTATIKAWGLHGVFQKLKGLPAETIAQLFPNIRGLRGAIPAIQHIEEYGKYMNDIANRAGAAEEAFRKMTEENPLWLLLKRTSQSIITISRAIGESLAPELNKLSGKLYGITDNVVNFIKAHRWMVVTLAAVSAALITSGMSLITMGLGLRVVALALRSVGRVIKGVWKSLVFLVSPLGLVTVAVSLLGAAFYNVVNAMGRGDTFVKKLGDLLKRASDALPRISDMWQAVVRFGGAVFGGFLEGVRLFGAAIQGAIRTVVGLVKNGALAIGRFFANLASSIKGVIVGIVDTITAVFKKIVNNEIVKLFTGLPIRSLVAVTKVVGTFLLGLYRLTRDIGQWFATAYLWVLGVFVKQASKLLGKLLSVVIDFAIHSANPILKFLLIKTWAFIQDSIKFLFDKIRWAISGVKSVFGSVVGAIVEVLQGITAAFNGVLGVVSSNWKSFWKWMDDVVFHIFSSYTRESLVDDLKYLESAFKHWALVSELAITNWATAVVGAFEDVKAHLQQTVKQLALMWKWRDPEKLIQGYVKKYGPTAGPLMAVGDFFKDMGDVGSHVETELEKGLKLRVAELEKQLGGKFADDMLKEKLPAIPDLSLKNAEDIARLQRKGFDDFLGGQGDMFSTKQSLPTLAERGTAEAYSVITQQDPLTETAKNTKDMVGEQKKTNKLLQDQMQQRKTDPYGAPVNLGLTP